MATLKSVLKVIGCTVALLLGDFTLLWSAQFLCQRMMSHYGCSEGATTIGCLATALLMFFGLFINDRLRVDRQTTRLGKVGGVIGRGMIGGIGVGGLYGCVDVALVGTNHWPRFLMELIVLFCAFTYLDERHRMRAYLHLQTSPLA
jgi:hypothetical protein